MEQTVNKKIFSDEEKKQALVDGAVMLEMQDMMRIFKSSRRSIERRCSSKREGDWLPSYKIFGKRLFDYNEVMYYRDLHKEEFRGRMRSTEEEYDDEDR